MKRHQAGLGFIFVTLFIDILGFGLIVPILPQLIASLSHGNVAAAARYYGWFLAVYGAMQFVASPVLGSLSDQWGRRPVLLLSLFTTGIDYIVMAVAPTVGWLFVGRTISGITGASFTAANAYIADVSPPEKRAQNFGLVGGAFALGFILGPAIGGLLGEIGPRVPFMAAAGLALVNWLYGFFVLPESLAVENRRVFSWRRSSPIASFGILARFPIVLGLTVATVLSGLGQQALQSTWVLYNSYRFRWTSAQNGLSLAAVGLLAGIVQAGLMRTLVARFGEKRLVLIGLGSSASSLALYGMATAGWMMYAILIVGAMGFVGGPVIQGLISKQYGPDEQGAAQGALSGLVSLTGIVGPLVSTALFGYFVSKAAPVRVPGAAFFFGAVLSFSGFVAAAIALRARPIKS
ncbi:MAG TPA: TCR/Tet family MFS transporter [Armatimonadota bacterium]|nr:TCR/Tet family MFS transporter [Armatimonadota bacterium]